MNFKFLKENYNKRYYTESLMDEIHFAHMQMRKAYGPEVTDALDDYFQINPKANVFFDEEQNKKFLDWARVNGYQLKESCNDKSLDETVVGTIAGAIAGAKNSKDGLLKGAIRGATLGSGISNMIAGKGNAVVNAAKVGTALGGGDNFLDTVRKGAQYRNQLQNALNGKPVQNKQSSLVKNTQQLNQTQQQNNTQQQDNSPEITASNFRNHPKYRDFKNSQLAPDYELNQFKNYMNNQKNESLTEAVEDGTFEAFLTNLGKYNEGELVGDWFEFPMDADEFEDALKEIGIGSKDEFGNKYEEWFVSDYEDPIGHAYESLGEYPSLEALNEYASFANGADHDTFAAILEDQGDFESAKEIYESGDYAFYPGVTDWGDFAEMYIDEVDGGVENLPMEEIERYFDYEALGRELDFDTYTSEDDDGNEVDMSAGEYWCGDENATDQEIGEAYVDAVGMDGVGHPEYYFDFDAYGRDLSFDNFTMTDYGVIEIF